MSTLRHTVYHDDAGRIVRVEIDYTGDTPDDGVVRVSIDTRTAFPVVVDTGNRRIAVRVGSDHTIDVGSLPR